MVRKYYLLPKLPWLHLSVLLVNFFCSSGCQNFRKSSLTFSCATGTSGRWPILPVEYREGWAAWPVWTPGTWPSLLSKHPTPSTHRYLPGLLISFWTTPWGSQASPCPVPLFRLPLPPPCLPPWIWSTVSPTPCPSVTISSSESHFCPRAPVLGTPAH